MWLCNCSAVPLSPSVLGVKGGSNCLLAGFFGANANCVINRTDEHFAVADLAGLGGFDDGLDSRNYHAVGENDFDFDLGQKINGVFAAAVNFGMAFLTAKAFDLGNRHAFDAEARKRLFDVFQLEGLDNGLNLFHVVLLLEVDTNNRGKAVNRKLKNYDFVIP